MLLLVQITSIFYIFHSLSNDSSLYNSCVTFDPHMTSVFSRLVHWKSSRKSHETHKSVAPSPTWAACRRWSRFSATQTKTWSVSPPRPSPTWPSSAVHDVQWDNMAASNDWSVDMATLFRIIMIHISSTFVSKWLYLIACPC